jgi:hypothetical protein
MESHSLGKTEFPGKASFTEQSFHKAAESGNIGHFFSIAEIWRKEYGRQS